MCEKDVHNACISYQFLQAGKSPMPVVHTASLNVMYWLTINIRFVPDASPSLPVTHGPRSRRHPHRSRILRHEDR